MKKIILALLLLSFGLFAGQIKLIDENASDFAYQLPLKKYPKFLCEATLENGKTVQFVSVKAMMQVYFHQKYFIKHKFIDSKIKKMYVQDFLSGEKIDAKKALYVFGSRVIGPHGDDLVPLKDQESYKVFKIKYKGTKVLPFDRLTVGLIRYLDM
jgi:hypothetical protein